MAAPILHHLHMFLEITFPVQTNLSALAFIGSEAQSHVQFVATAAGGKAGTAGKVTPVPMTLRTMVRSRAYVLGALVKPRFTKNVECQVVMDPAKLNKPISLEKACQYS